MEINSCNDFTKMGSEGTFNTEFSFILPKGLIDDRGNAHRHGVMRLATAKDEIWVQKDHRVRENPEYSVLIMLARTIARLGSLPVVTPDLLEGLFTLDLAYLREFYNRINQQGDARIPVQCPCCNGQFKVELSLSGES